MTAAPQLVGSPLEGGGPTPSLSAREAELLLRVANGESYRHLARDWHVQEITVRTTGARVLRKLGANSIAHAVFIACRLRILDPTRRHGDHAGYAAHVYRGEQPCEACKEGESAYRAKLRAARKAASGNT